MDQDKDTMPSDREDSTMKPAGEKKKEPPTPPPENEKSEKDPSEQPS